MTPCFFTHVAQAKIMMNVRFHIFEFTYLWLSKSSFVCIISIILFYASCGVFFVLEWYCLKWLDFFFFWLMLKTLGQKKQETTSCRKRKLIILHRYTVLRKYSWAILTQVLHWYRQYYKKTKLLPNFWNCSRARVILLLQIIMLTANIKQQDRPLTLKIDEDHR